MLLEAVESQQLPHRKLWTRDEAAKIAGLFPDKRYELIEGVLFDKMGQLPPHAYAIVILSAILSEVFPRRVRVQLPIRLPDPEGIRSEPEPDIVLLHEASTRFAHTHPLPEDIALLIEVSDTSLALDRQVKGRIYARTGIQNYWIIEIPNRRVTLLSEPSADVYKSVLIREAHEQLTWPYGPSFPVRELFAE